MPSQKQMKRPTAAHKAACSKKPAARSMKKPAASAKSVLKRPAAVTRTPATVSQTSSSEVEDDQSDSIYEANSDGHAVDPVHVTPPEGDQSHVPAQEVDPCHVASQEGCNADDDNDCLIMVHVPDFFPGCIPAVPENHEPSQDAQENAPCGWLPEWDFLTQPQRIFLINRGPDGIFPA